VYIADQDINDVFELYRTVFFGGANTKLNPAYTLGKNVEAFVIVPNSTGVIYRANQDAPGVNELYRVLFVQAGTSTRLISPAMGPGQNVGAFAATSDNVNVVYIANRTSPTSNDLYVVPSAGGVSSQLNPIVQPNRNVTGFAVTPDGLSVVYRADQDTDEVFELYRTVILTLANSKLNPNLTAGKNVTSFGVIPDNSGVVYIADQTTDDVFELFRSLFSGIPPTSPLNPPFSDPPFFGTRDVTDFVLFPNGAGVVYRADQTTDSVNEIYRVVFGFPGSPRINTPLVTVGQNVLTYAVAPDSLSAIYRANQDNIAIIELYRTMFSSLETSTKLNTPLVAPENVADFTVR
jgi:hypothetical protein